MSLSFLLSHIHVPTTPAGWPPSYTALHYPHLPRTQSNSAFPNLRPIIRHTGPNTSHISLPTRLIPFSQRRPHTGRTLRSQEPGGAPETPLIPIHQPQHSFRTTSLSLHLRRRYPTVTALRTQPLRILQVERRALHVTRALPGHAGEVVFGIFEGARFVEHQRYESGLGVEGGYAEVGEGNGDVGRCLGRSTTLACRRSIVTAGRGGGDFDDVCCADLAAAREDGAGTGGVDLVTDGEGGRKSAREGQESRAEGCCREDRHVCRRSCCYYAQDRCPLDRL